MRKEGRAKIIAPCPQDRVTAVCFIVFWYYFLELRQIEVNFGQIPSRALGLTIFSELHLEVVAPRFEDVQGSRQGDNIPQPFVIAAVARPTYRSLLVLSLSLSILSGGALRDVAASETAYRCQVPPTSMGPEPAMDYVRRAVWGMLFADDACIVPRSPQWLAKMMEVIVEVCRAFALTVSAKNTETMCMPPPRISRTMVQIEAAGQTYKQVQSFTYLRGAVTEVPDMSVEIARRTRACWMRIRRYLRELHDQPKVALFLKTRMVKAEAIESLLYECSTWTLRQEHYAKLRTVHHRVLLRIIGAQRKRPDHRMTSYNRTLEITGCESIETTLRTRRLLWAGTLLRMSGGRLPKRIVFGNLEGAVRRGRGGKEKEWTDCVQSDIRAFGIAGDWKATA